MVPAQRAVKRAFDIVFALLCLVLSAWLVLICWAIATVDTRQNGFFTQERVGESGRLFRVVKIRTMRSVPGISTSVTSRNDPRITRLGRFFRRTKLDELPQFLNVLVGQMSFVGPRPEVPGFADRLEGADREILSVRPGITGPATLVFRNEEGLLARCSEPELYNRDVIFREKVRLNREYLRSYSFTRDLVYIAGTLIPSLGRWIAPDFTADGSVAEGKATAKSAARSRAKAVV